MTEFKAVVLFTAVVGVGCADADADALAADGSSVTEAHSDQCTVSVEDACAADGPCDSGYHPCVASRRCGDGFIWNEDGGSEACDDGNTEPLDGCDSTCTIESGYVCVGETF